MDKENYKAKIRQVGNNLVEAFKRNGNIGNGLNGPYDDDETEVRYLAHLAVIASVESQKYGRQDCRDVAEEIGCKLLSMHDGNHVYKMRVKPGKDECNGVIGHAWLVEGLLYVYKVTGDQKYLDESEKICKNHAFNNKIGLWGRPLKGCGDSAIDFTFNHQLWYAVTLAELLKERADAELQRQLDTFLMKLPELVTFNRDGRVAHGIYKRVSWKGTLKYKMARVRNVVKEKAGKPSLSYKEVGYHTFNLMAFARLYRLCPDAPIFKTKQIWKALDFLKKDYFQKELEEGNIRMDASTHGKTLTKEESSINIYGYPYNVPGFEAMYCKAVFGDAVSDEAAQRLMERQMALTWDEEQERLGRLCHDKVSVNYRVYEYYRYFEITE